eukprot:CAMPEP_0201215012 /NCGR_PEP_ID=MMETSP0851-20130426/188718_1 /ASSEMBLY_ACC=CAM_ASM_000631 /TAXON_ID=183588 /ORGANISM="Pseudo-nitzschia fraudulenta, Strain WWA7" /LENGTH=1083 /DNA_ID=CAMNT_0047504413 /DNA_START=206 /DNA_END=3454 /DNA_ORIENTATION=-
MPRDVSMPTFPQAPLVSNVPSALPKYFPSAMPSALHLPMTVPLTQPTFPPTPYVTKSPIPLPTILPVNRDAIMIDSPKALPKAVTKSPTSSTPSFVPTITPTPTSSPTVEPTLSPTVSPTPAPTRLPTEAPTPIPTLQPTSSPTFLPTLSPTHFPTQNPTNNPTQIPTQNPTHNPTRQPTQFPTKYPTKIPSDIPSIYPSIRPSPTPSSSPSSMPSGLPTNNPSWPSPTPSSSPSSMPSGFPTNNPSNIPSVLPSTTPSGLPSIDPTGSPSNVPSGTPSSIPSSVPSVIPSDLPSMVPSGIPSDIPSSVPSVIPSELPSMIPSGIPSHMPSTAPSMVPSVIPSELPSTSVIPSNGPSNLPTNMLSNAPSGTHWNLKGESIYGKQPGDNSGYSVSLSADGTRVAIGSPHSGCSRGRVSLYEYIRHEWVQVGSDIDGEATGDQSGYAVSMSADGTKIAVGAPYNDGSGTDSGHVSVFAHISGTGWTQLGSDIDGEAEGDQSGYAISMCEDGTRVAIGAPFNNANNAENSGHVRIYEYTSGVWKQLGSDIDGEAPDDQSGSAVSMSAKGTRVAIGAVQNDGISGIDRGHVKIYEYESSDKGWNLLGSAINGESSYDNFGHSVSLSADGTTVAIGAIDNNDGGSRSGHVKVYKYPLADGEWEQLGSVFEGEDELERMGFSVSISGDGKRVAISSPKPTAGTTGSRMGLVKIFEYSSSDDIWTQVGFQIGGLEAGDESGYSVSISADGTRVACGAIFNENNGIGSGSVSVYGFGDTTPTTSPVLTYSPSVEPSYMPTWAPSPTQSSTWSQFGFDIDGEAASDYSGRSVSMSSDGTRVAIGAPNNNGNGTGSWTGHVRVYAYTRFRGGNTFRWQQLGCDIDGEEYCNDSGSSVSMSSDGSRVAIGAPYNSGSASTSGHTRVYEFSLSIGWIQVGSDIDGEAENDYSGGSVVMSSDGTRVAIGASSNDGNGSGSGHVRVFDYSSSSGWIQVGSDIDGDNEWDQSGSSVSMSSDGTRVAIGASYNDGNDGSGSGHVRVFDYSSSDGWIQVGSDIDGEAESDNSGRSVSMSSDGTRIAIGADGNDGNGRSSG